MTEESGKGGVDALQKPVVLVDLDGTLALIEHRLHHIQGEEQNWNEFYSACPDDEPNPDVIQVVRMLSVSYPVIIVTGRSAEVMEQSITWLHQHGVPYTYLMMRPEGDHRPDDELKEWFMEKYNWGADNVLCVLEDRSRVVEMWRRRGLTCLQVAGGDF